ncbi:hypothetical protein PC122_g10478 [Phytophthora cactorum]|nr:hypothetical protein PC122_g10478 [Phytophthora cactorum]
MATPPPVKDVVPPKPTKSRRQSNGNGNLTNYQRKVICEFYRKSGGVMSQKDLAQWTKHEFGLKKTPAQSTISGILRRQHEFINMSSLELGHEVGGGQLGRDHDRDDQARLGPHAAGA